MSAADSVLRLAGVQICGYRGFPNPIAVWLARHDGVGKILGRGRNLLLFGENGSGKSSFGKAIRDFLDFRPTAIAFDEFRYRYTDPPRTDRGVSLVFDDSAIDPLTWNPTTRDTAHREFADMARSCGWLDYRVVWRVSEVRLGDSVDIFRLLVEQILPRCPRGSSTETFGDTWTRIVSAAEKQPIKYGRAWGLLATLQADLKLFNDSLEAFLPDLEKQVNALITRFAPWTSIQLGWQGGARYDSRSRSNKFSWGSIRLRMIDRGTPLTKPSEFLNEARLTAIGLCLYLAGMSQSIPPKRMDGSSYPRLLVLDDVLLSLDMIHRLPLLELLAAHEFVDWQILLLTHHRAWYEIAKQQLRDWAHYELFAQRVGDYEQPLIVPDVPHLDRARAFLAPAPGGTQPPDFKAAAVHLRTEFELILKRGCEGLQLAVPFRRNPREVTANALWRALQDAELPSFPLKVSVENNKGEKIEYWRKEKATRVVSTVLRDRVSFALSWVLNPLSHSESIDRYLVEVTDAPAALDELSTAVDEAIAEKQLREAISRSTLLSTLVKKASANLAPLEGLDSHRPTIPTRL
jgi:hypothetical protein